jgi:hypothetical protein
MAPRRDSFNSVSAVAESDLARAASFGRQRLHGSGLEHAGFASRHRRIGHKAQPRDPANRFTFNRDHAIFFNARHQTFLLGQPPHQYTGFAVNETMCEALVQDVREPVLDLLGTALPIDRCFQPVRSGWQ